MSCYTGATQSSIIKPNVDRDILPLDVAVSLNLLPLIFGNGFTSFRVVLELSDHGHQQLSPFYRVEYRLTFLPDIGGNLPVFQSVYLLLLLSEVGS